MTNRNTSMRLTEAERALIDAYRRYMFAEHGTNMSRSDAIRALLRRIPYPEGELTEHAGQLRRAYSGVFGRPTGRTSQ